MLNRDVIVCVGLLVRWASQPVDHNPKGHDLSIEPSTTFERM
ncbi:hypothetical protein RBSWK_02228 [Rhodopirellula baltica SWK14]|uniref:Uncharacterized protein n=1 Tax=Rhodopirellula baltica SWK14 TaxID=993516 RepID=L7CKD7_RHOBT|nr:hypothetical protein RBSWK_02228 [Rhodopirellula baltica SWK14]